MFSLIAGLMRKHGAAQGLVEFKQTAEYRDALQQWPEVATSFTNQFLATGAEETSLKLERIIMDSPHPDRAAWSRLQIPTLILGNRQDPVHPFEFGLELSRVIPQSRFEEITPKSVSLERHTADVQRSLERFLKELPGD